MQRLICAEYKKLWKSKLTLCMLLFLGIYTVYVVNASCSGVGDSYTALTGNEFRDVDGTVVSSGKAYLRFADQFHHKFEGELIEVEQQYHSLYKEVMEGVAGDKLDEKAMNQRYGDYESLKNQIMGKTFTQLEIIKQLERYPMLDSYCEQQTCSLVFPTIYYENDPIRVLYENLYHNDYRYFAEPMGNGVNTHTILGDHEQSEVIHIALQGEYHDIVENLISNGQTTRYDSVIGNNVFLLGSRCVNFVTLLILIVLLSNCFAMERYTKTDQILMSSCKGTTKTVWAKIWMAISFSIFLVLVQYLIAITITSSYVPLRDLTLTAMTQAGVTLGGIPSFLYTYLEIISIQVLLQLVACIATALLTLACSYCTKHQVSCVLIMLTFVITSYYASELRLAIGPIRFFSLGTMMEVCTYLDISSNLSSFPYIQIGNMILGWSVLVLAFWLFVSGMVVVGMIQHSKKHQVMTC